MGLLMAAPTVSRTLMALSVIPAMQMSGPEMSPAAGPADADVHHHGAPRTPAPPTTDACGYCSLMFHSPALATVALVLLQPRLSPASPQAPHGVATPVPGWLDLRSRGPPWA